MFKARFDYVYISNYISKDIYSLILQSNNPIFPNSNKRRPMFETKRKESTEGSVMLGVIHKGYPFFLAHFGPSFLLISDFLAHF